MRKWVLTFLIVIYTGLHSAAAIGAAQTAGELVLPTQVAIQNASIVSEALTSHNIRCCNRTSNQAKFQKPTKCGIECVSVFVSLEVKFLNSKLDLGDTALPGFFSREPKPENRPPRSY
jgi:hypothetical protein